MERRRVMPKNMLAYVEREIMPGLSSVLEVGHVQRPDEPTDFLSAALVDSASEARGGISAALGWSDKASLESAFAAHFSRPSAGHQYQDWLDPSTRRALGEALVDVVLAKQVPDPLAEIGRRLGHRPNQGIPMAHVMHSKAGEHGEPGWGSRGRESLETWGKGMQGGTAALSAARPAYITLEFREGEDNLGAHRVERFAWQPWHRAASREFGIRKAVGLGPLSNFELRRRSAPDVSGAVHSDDGSGEYDQGSWTTIGVMDIQPGEVLQLRQVTVRRNASSASRTSGEQPQQQLLQPNQASPIREFTLRKRRNNPQDAALVRQRAQTVAASARQLDLASNDDASHAQEETVGSRRRAQTTMERLAAEKRRRPRSASPSALASPRSPSVQRVLERRTRTKRALTEASAASRSKVMPKKTLGSAAGGSPVVRRVKKTSTARDGKKPNKKPGRKPPPPPQPPPDLSDADHRAEELALIAQFPQFAYVFACVAWHRTYLIIFLSDLCWCLDRRMRTSKLSSDR